MATFKAPPPSGLYEQMRAALIDAVQNNKPLPAEVPEISVSAKKRKGAQLDVLAEKWFVALNDNTSITNEGPIEYLGKWYKFGRKIIEESP